MKKLLLALSLISSSLPALAGGDSNWAVPQGLDIIGVDGVRIYGEFGNPNNCGITNQLFIKASHPQYDQLYATALTAFTAQSEIKLYIGSCEVISWLSTKTINVYTNGGSQMSIR